MSTHSSAAGGDVPRPPPRRRSTIVSGQQRSLSFCNTQEHAGNSGQAPRRSFTTTVSLPYVNEVDR